MAIGKEVLASLNEIVEHEKGMKTKVRSTLVRIDDEVDVRLIREKLALSQQKFSDLYGVPVATLQNWESGRRRPEVAARLFLKAIASYPEMVAKAIRSR